MATYYSVDGIKPRLSLDFLTANLDSQISFTRSGNDATRVNASGLIEAVNANTPRFDYSPASGACNGLLIEEARTNLLSNSADVSTWTNVGGLTITTNVAAAPGWLAWGVLSFVQLLMH